MTFRNHALAACVAACFVLLIHQRLIDAASVLEYPPADGAGKGKHVVFLTGDEEYRSEEGLPMLARLLSQRHGFHCTVLLPIDPKSGYVDPNNRQSLPGSEALDSADLIVMLIRFRTWPEEVMQRFERALHRGVPIVALRTSTHPFAFPEEHPRHAWNQFGENVLGENWVSHWGRHKQEATRGIAEQAMAAHPLLNGVEDVFGDSDVYEAYPPSDARILLRGQVLSGMSPDSPPADYPKTRTSDGQTQPINEPMMPIAWIREVKQANGETNRIFCTTMGAATDLASAGLRRLIVNAVFWGLEIDVPSNADVRPVGEYRPSAYGFDGFRRRLRLDDFALTDDVPPSRLPLRFKQGERIALIGNCLAERMNLFGHFEALLHSRFADHELVIRNFARPADAVDNRHRPTSYTAIDDPLEVFGPDTFFCFYGFNESFGAIDPERFAGAYEKHLDELEVQYARDGLGAPPRFVLVTPIAAEPTGNPLWPDATSRNARLKAYAEAVIEVGRRRGLAVVDLFTPTAPMFAAESGMQFTINGCHLNEQGDRAVGLLLDRALFGDSTPAQLDSAPFQRLRAAVNEKSWIHQQDYRMINGWYVYGGRRTFDIDTFPREYQKIRDMAALRDRYVWALARGESPAPPDDRLTGELPVPPTRFGAPGQEYSEPEELRYLSPEAFIKTLSLPPDFEVKLFASEREFPELAKPNQMNFDSRGRLWVSCMPTYPQWKPGNSRPNDRLLIFEDADGDGVADSCTTFYDKLHCPTGFEFWNGGVLVVDQPRLLWLKDSDGDDRADVVVHLLDGWATDDTHHTIGAFEYSHGGLLHMLEGIAMSTTVETPWGPHRRKDASGAHILDPRTLKLQHYVTPGYGNPWCYVFDTWGRGIVGDGTNAQQHWDSPLSGAPVASRRGFDPIFDNQGMRPAVGSEFLLSRHLPDDVQGQFIYACVINMNGIPRFAIHDKSSGMEGYRIVRREPDGHGGTREVPDDLLSSTDKGFRPVDPQIGPDGAVWFGDWCNVIIGHMQYSQRDPNRDHQHGRIYRLVHRERPLLEPVTQYGKSEVELLEQLREYEPRTRYRARRELHSRPTTVVVEAVGNWTASLDPKEPEYDRLLLEGLWVLQSHHALDPHLLNKALHSPSHAARAAATHLVADERDYLPNAFELLRSQIHDDHPRVRHEAVRGMSFFNTLEACQAALGALDHPTDSWIDYTLEHTIAALEPAWKEAYHDGTLKRQNEKGYEFIHQYVERQRPSLAAEAHLKIALDVTGRVDRREASLSALEAMQGNLENGASVFRRVCAACHKIRDVGYSFGPDLDDVGKRLSRREIIDSILEPSKKVDPKYVATTVLTSEGKVETGLVVSRTDSEVSLLVADGEQKTIPLENIEEVVATNVSSMPENLAATMAPVEFLDLVEYLCSMQSAE